MARRVIAELTPWWRRGGNGQPEQGRMPPSPSGGYWPRAPARPGQRSSRARPGPGRSHGAVPAGPGPLSASHPGDVLILAGTAALLPGSQAGAGQADPRGELRVVAASSEAARLLELFQLQSDQGPCLDCFRSGQPVTVTDLTTQADRWPRFAAAARDAGFTAVQALPMRLREQVIGALNLFRAAPGPFDPAGIGIG
jgi:hypothetical protein